MKKVNHKLHKKQILIGPFGPHYAKEICLTCNNLFLGWKTKAEYRILITAKNESDRRTNTTVNLRVPYEQREKVKALGGHWDSYLKVWFIDPRLFDIAFLQKFVENGWITNEELIKVPG